MSLSDCISEAGKRTELTVLFWLLQFAAIGLRLFSIIKKIRLYKQSRIFLMLKIVCSSKKLSGKRS